MTHMASITYRIPRSVSLALALGVASIAGCTDGDDGAIGEGRAALMCQPTGNGVEASIRVDRLVGHGELQGFWSLLHISDVPAGAGVAAGEYDAWCLEEGNLILTPGPERARLLDGLPPGTEGIDLPRIAWIINNKGDASKASVQHAIWLFTGDRQEADIERDAVSNGPTDSIPAQVRQLHRDALARGGDFAPQAGDIDIMVVDHTGGEQMLIVEVDCTPEERPEPDLGIDMGPPQDARVPDMPPMRPRLRTQTPGGWGTMCRGNNPGCYRDAHFAAAFPEGLEIGHPDGHTARFTASAAIQAVMPSAGRPRPLDGSTVDAPALDNTLAGHAIALTLSLGFDRHDPDFGEADVALGDMIFADGPCAGSTVDGALADANRVLAGLDAAQFASALTACLTAVNENYVDGEGDGGALRAP